MLDCFERGERPGAPLQPRLARQREPLAQGRRPARAASSAASPSTCRSAPTARRWTPTPTSAPRGVAGLIAAAVERLDLSAVTLVGNDSGGAYSQIALAQHGERIGEPGLRPRPHLLRDARTTSGRRRRSTACPRRRATPRRSASCSARSRTPRSAPLPVAYGLLLKHPVEPEALRLLRAPGQPRPRRAARRRQGDGVGLDRRRSATPASTLIAARDLPTLLIWSSEDEVFPLAHAERYASALPQRRAWSRSTTPSASPRRTGRTPSPRRSGRSPRSPTADAAQSQRDGDRHRRRQLSTAKKSRSNPSAKPATSPAAHNCRCRRADPAYRRLRPVGGRCEEAADQGGDEEVAEAHRAEPKWTACRRGRSPAGRGGAEDRVRALEQVGGDEPGVDARPSRRSRGAARAPARPRPAASRGRRRRARRAPSPPPRRRASPARPRRARRAATARPAAPSR